MEGWNTIIKETDFMARPKPVALLILDGWGYSPDNTSNAIAKAHTPTWDHLLAHYPHTLISGSGEDVGLPEGQMGNSEVGHLTLGAGRVIYQDLSRITNAIEQGDFFQNPVLINAFNQAKRNQKSVHILGLLSPGGVHSHEDHIFAALTMAAQQQVSSVYVHAFLDGRDTPPQSARTSIEKLEQVAAKTGAHIATICGRYYAMDRDKRWERVQLAFNALVYGQAPFHAKTALDALDLAYARKETDEFVKPTIIVRDNEPPVIIHPGDVVIYMNFRSDRARALTYAFTDPLFEGFERGNYPHLSEFVCLTEYAENINAQVVFKPQVHRNVLGEYLQNLHLKQLHVAETEKYAHVTFFFNGGIETPFQGEERILIPSPKVATYDLVPEMSAIEVTQTVVNNILHGQFDFIVCNYANADMLGHTGNFSATVKAIETLDSCLHKIFDALEKVDGEALITSDHGNAEMMFDEISGQMHTAHTTSLVPLIYFGKQKCHFKEGTGKLSDVAPTLLYLLQLSQPEEMTGTSLLQPGNV